MDDPSCFATIRAQADQITKLQNMLAQLGYPQPGSPQWEEKVEDLTRMILDAQRAARRVANED